MRERLVSLLLALAALVTFYSLWMRPSSSFDPDADVARPTTAERLGNGYAGLFEWLAQTRVRARSLRERYTALADLDNQMKESERQLTAATSQAERDKVAARQAEIRRQQRAAQERLDKVKAGVKLKCPPDQPLC